MLLGGQAAHRPRSRPGAQCTLPSLAWHAGMVRAHSARSAHSAYSAHSARNALSALQERPTLPRDRTQAATQARTYAHTNIHTYTHAHNAAPAPCCAVGRSQASKPPAERKLVNDFREAPSRSQPNALDAMNVNSGVTLRQVRRSNVGDRSVARKVMREAWGLMYVA